jgi:hypothetical protein
LEQLANLADRLLHAKPLARALESRGRQLGNESWILNDSAHCQGKGRRIRLRFMTQTKIRPPTYMISVSQPEELGDEEHGAPPSLRQLWESVVLLLVGLVPWTFTSSPSENNSRVENPPPVARRHKQSDSHDGNSLRLSRAMIQPSSMMVLPEYREEMF